MTSARAFRQSFDGERNLATDKLCVESVRVQLDWLKLRLAGEWSREKMRCYRCYKPVYDNV